MSLACRRRPRLGIRSSWISVGSFQPVATQLGFFPARSVDRAAGEALAVLLVTQQPRAQGLGRPVVLVLQAHADRLGLVVDRADSLVDRRATTRLGVRDRTRRIVDEPA